MIDLWHAFKHKVVAWSTVWLDISDNILYIITLTTVKTRMGIKFRQWWMQMLLDKTAAKIERERKN